MLLGGWFGSAVWAVPPGRTFADTDRDSNGVEGMEDPDFEPELELLEEEEAMLKRIVIGNLPELS